jgi:hypothetical protein
MLECHYAQCHGAFDVPYMCIWQVKQLLELLYCGAH